MRSRPDRKPRPPLDEEALERLALFYVGRYATTRSRLAGYLTRKLAERGWAGCGQAPVERLVERFCGLGYLDDRAFASARASSLLRRGYGPRRIGEALRAAGIGEADGRDARLRAEDEAVEAARRFALRRRLGPYAPAPEDREGRRKAVAAMIRAGHGFEAVRTVLDASAADLPEEDVP